jgi:YggT family protein
MIRIIFNLADVLLSLYSWAIILAALHSLLVSFGVLDTRNRMVWTIGDFLYRITDPVLRPVRNFLPNLGNIDISPIIVLLLIQYAIRPLLRSLYAAIEFGEWQGLLF